MKSHSVVSDSLWLHGLYSPWHSPGQNTGVGSLSLLQGIFPTQGLNPVSHIAGGFSTSWATREAHKEVIYDILSHKWFAVSVLKSPKQRESLWPWQGLGGALKLSILRQKGSGVLRPLLVFNPSLTHCEFWEGMVYLIVFHLSFAAGRVERNHWED